MKAQPLTTELLDELSGFDQSVLLSEFKQRRYLFECDKAIRVDPAEGYMCKGIVYALSNDFDRMYESFQIAMRLAPGDDLIKTNFIASMGNFGRFEEMKEMLGTQTIIEDSIKLHTFFRALISTLELEALKEINSDYVNTVEKALSSLNLEFKDVKSYIFLFNNLMYQKKLRFGMVPSISWLVEDDDLFVYYDFVGTANQSMEIMDEFDKLVINLGLKQIARKLTIVLLPLSVC
ncbi:tetratricopeptide repeat protein [Acinetobacter terrestris]|uniref:Tetratricopeptide repeat protein n=1 Tax=Acinetobacter terrestris TaxID=2529843 RepID=A0ABX1UTZ2_9GAMM|nr:hypothetical protein [Acinetobacter terrestris]NNH25673.1 hypothetical protein [Acinetobacter terrestris]